MHIQDGHFCGLHKEGHTFQEENILYLPRVWVVSTLCLGSHEVHDGRSGLLDSLRRLDPVTSGTPHVQPRSLRGKQIPRAATPSVLLKLSHLSSQSCHLFCHLFLASCSCSVHLLPYAQSTRSQVPSHRFVPSGASGQHAATGPEALRAPGSLAQGGLRLHHCKLNL